MSKLLNLMLYILAIVLMMLMIRYVNQKINAKPIKPSECQIVIYKDEEYKVCNGEVVE